MVKHCQFAWEIVEFQSLKALPIWRFLDHFSLEKSCDRLVHWTVINIGSNRRGNFSLSVELSSFIFLLLYHELWVMIRNVHVLWTLCVDGLKSWSFFPQPYYQHQAQGVCTMSSLLHSNDFCRCYHGRTTNGHSSLP